MPVGTYSEEDFEEMDNPTLVSTWALLDNGRQYDGVEHDRRRCGRVMAQRLAEDSE